MMSAIHSQNVHAGGVHETWPRFGGGSLISRLFVTVFLMRQLDCPT